MSTSEATDDNYYATHGESTALSEVPVVKNEAAIEDNVGSSEQADSNAQLGTFVRPCLLVCSPGLVANVVVT